MENSYRKRNGLVLPGEGALVRIEPLVECGFYIAWHDCPDRDNILFLYLRNRLDAIAICIERNWKIISK